MRLFRTLIPAALADIDVEAPQQPAFALNETEIFESQDRSSHFAPRLSNLQRQWEPVAAVADLPQPLAEQR